MPLSRGTASQIPLDLSLKTDYSKARFVRAQSNSEGCAALDTYPNWANGALAIIGPKGSGKTHIGTLWTEEHEALNLVGEADVANIASWRGQAIWVDDASHASEELLFALINMAIRKDISGLLLTDSLAPATWPVQIPDLRSRLGAMQVAKLEAPDDDLLEAIMRKLFLDRGLKVSDALISYLLLRTERSVDAASALVMSLDKAAAAEKANVTRSFAVQYFERQNSLEQGEVF